MVAKMPELPSWKRTVGWFIGSVAATAIAAALAGAPTARGQNHDPGLTGVDHTDDVVMARQMLAGVDENMTEIDLYRVAAEARADRNSRRSSQSRKKTSGPDGSAARGEDHVPGLTGVDHADDVVMARQMLMDGIDENMMAIDLYGTGTNVPLADLRARADRISALLTAFPHLFPPQTKPSDKLTIPTTATPAIWENFDAFYGSAQSAAMTAFEASKADTTATKFKELGAQLRADCDGCHAKYMHVEGGPKP